MLTAFKNHIEEQFPFLKNSRLVIAISGGIDSVVLAQLCHKLNFDFALVTGIGRQLTKGPVIEKGEYKGVDTMVGALDKLFTSGKLKMELDGNEKVLKEKIIGAPPPKIRGRAQNLEEGSRKFLSC